MESKWIPNWMRAIKVPLQQNRLTAYWAALRRVFASRSKDVIFPQLRRPYLKCCVIFATCYKWLTEKIQRRTTEMMKELQNFSSEERLMELGLFSLKNRRTSGMILSISVNTWRESTKKTEPSSVQWCPVTGPKAMGTN